MFFVIQDLFCHSRENGDPGPNSEPGSRIKCGMTYRVRHERVEWRRGDWTPVQSIFSEYFYKLILIYLFGLAAMDQAKMRPALAGYGSPAIPGGERSIPKKLHPGFTYRKSVSRMGSRLFY